MLTAVSPEVQDPPGHRGLLTHPVFASWRYALPLMDAATTEDAAQSEATGVLCTPAQWRTVIGGRDPELVARTVLGAVLAVNSGHPQIAVAIDDDGAPRIETMVVTPEATVTTLTRSWLPWGRADTPDAGGPARLRELVESAHLPLIRFNAPDDSGHVPSPLRCTVSPSADGLRWTIAADAGFVTRSALCGLLEQIGDVLHAVAGDPSVTIGSLAAILRSLTFDVMVLGSSSYVASSAAVSAWGRAVGLDVVVRRIEPWEVLDRPAAATGLRVPPRGAGVVVASPAITAQGALPREPAGLTATLPDGRPFAALGAGELRELYDEIVVRNRYLRHGVQISDGDLVVDVGANVGMFCVFAAAQAAGVRVEAFEPAPEPAGRLRVNMAAYAVDGQVHAVAVGAREQTRTLAYYPGSSLQSGFHTNTDTDRQIVQGYARQQISQRGLPHAEAVQMSAALDPIIGDRVGERHLVDVPVVRLSQWIHQHGVTSIGLLKIDVERAEEDVLAGIDDEHWPLVEQVVVEVHDIDGRVARVRHLLERHRMQVVVEQDEMFTGSEIVMVYGRRPAEAGPLPGWVSRTVTLAQQWQAGSALPVYVSVPPACPAADVLMIRRSVQDAGLAWIAPAEQPGAASSLSWAQAVLRQVTTTERPVLKAVVVDADNTLWAGVCGEIGPANVRCAGPYRQVQLFLAEQRKAGRVLALCTRNNVEDVRAVFAAHPDMPLRFGDFTLVQAGWGAKSTAVDVIAGELGFAVESLAYVDDSPVERAEVALAHPGMTVVDLPVDPAGYVAALQATWQLTLSPGSTEEDRRRTRLLADDQLRRGGSHAAASVPEYLEELQLQVDVAPAAAGDVARISQLAARTTQFNLMLRAHTPATVTALIAEGGPALAVRVRDRFGDYGLVGFAAAKCTGDTLQVTDFFLSCRALGRNVEWRMLQALAEYAVHRGLRRLEVAAVPGPRNRPALEFVAAAALPGCGGAGQDRTLDAASLAALRWREAGGRSSAPVAPAPALPRQGRQQPQWPVSTRTADIAGTLLRTPAPGTPFAAPQTAIEQQISRLWADTLGVCSIGLHDDLFALGCDSVTAALMCVRMHHAGLPVSFQDLLGHPTVHRTAAHLQQQNHTDRDRAALADPVEQLMVASPGQQRIWVAEVSAGPGTAQIIPECHRIRGALDVELLQSAFEVTIGRHLALRTGLREQDGTLAQHSTTTDSIVLPVIDLSMLPGHDRADAMTAAEQRFFSTPFDLGRDLMLRAQLLRHAPDDHTLLIACHHSAADGWSMDLIRRELSAAYAAAPHHRPAVAVPFTAYSTRVERRRLAGTFEPDAARAYARLPQHAANWSAPSGLPVTARHRRQDLGAAVTAAAVAAASSRGTIALTVHLAAFQLLLAMFSGRPDVVTGCPVANRDDPAFAETAGFIANLVPVTARIDWAGRIGDHLDMAVRRTTEALQHAAVPYGLLTEHGPAARFDTLFTLQPEHAHPLMLTDCLVTSVDPPRWPQPYPLMLDVQNTAQGASLLLRFDSNAVHPVEPQRILTAYPLTLAALCTLPDLPLHRLRDYLHPTSAAADRLRDQLVNIRTGRVS